MDITKATFAVKGPFRSGDGSFQFHVVVMYAAIPGAPPDVLGIADVRVDNDQVCAALGRALQQIAEQLPPQLVGLSQ